MKDRIVTETGYPRPSGGSPDFPALERDVLDYWASDDTFRASVRQRDDGPEYVFYDGPPFANGLPHYGHLLTGYVKDIVPRYRTMRGYKVERRFGWDTHGLPAELEVQRQLGITDKAQIEEMGIGAFNDACRDSVLQATPTNGVPTSPARPAGSTSTTTTRPWTPRSWSRSSGRSSSYGTRGWPTRACGCCRTAGTMRLRCPAMNCGWTMTSTSVARIRPSPSDSRSPHPVPVWTAAIC